MSVSVSADTPPTTFSALCQFSQWVGSQGLTLCSTTSNSTPANSDFGETKSYFMEQNIF